MHKITGVKVLESYRLELVFADGVRGIVDLSDLVGKGVFALWNNYRAFEQVRIGSSGELVWNDQIDLCPDALYLRATGKRPEDVAIEEIRHIRHRIWARYGHDTRALLKHYQDLEKRYAARILKETHFVIKEKNTT